ncbi:MAG: (1-_4)-alpha-D-glucan 1-alpha-D-glucosylmutase [Chloroflexota bacterium]|jgi:(1->4)-alpha-D-glucan 1-alpha-D-glucosylmutase|nr:(1->4)-alpha-D-glucan 1-alpha-D-glucosylmutase [Chloroflexota bacterium]
MTAAIEPGALDLKLQRIAAGVHIPGATYRLQLNAGFTFRDAAAIVPYLHALGITDVYTSPILQARAGSSHGYDITDHSRLNPELGTPADFAALVEALHAHSMGMLLDVVPNHMSIGEATNVWWLDVLENGPAAAHAPYFDVDWSPVKPELRNKVLLPILEDQFGKVLESGKLQLRFAEGAFWITYYETKLPVGPQTYSDILGCHLPELITTLGEEDAHVQELESILTAIKYLPSPSETAPEKRAERNREKEVIKRRIAALHQQSFEVRATIDRTIGEFNGDVHDPASFDLMDRLVGQQAYRLAFWRVSSEEINYRRFFDVNDLAAIRVESHPVFEATHAVVFDLLRQGAVDGLRIDHPDGLWDPRSYFGQLQARYLEDRLQGELGANVDRGAIAAAVGRFLEQREAHPNTGPHQWPLFVVAEKILAENEPLPADWAVNGTTGYEFLNLVSSVFVDSRNARELDQTYRAFAGPQTSFRNLTNTTRKMIMLVSLASEINTLSHQLERLAERNRRYRDFTLNSLTFAVREVIAALPVYRTYVTAEVPADERDESYVQAAVAEAKRRNPRTAASIFDFIGDTVLLRNIESFSTEDRPSVVEFAMKLQQVTGPVMAKGIEDTAFYVYNRLVSLNDVGGDPSRVGVQLREFHARNEARLCQWPHSLLATSTHDTKRSEDVRARINVISEIPREWRAAVGRWGKMNAAHRTNAGGTPAPDHNDEYLLYQTLVGAWPDTDPTPEELAVLRERIGGYMLKATKEAKTHTSWINPNEAYDEAIQEFVGRVLADPEHNAFLADFCSLQRRIAHHGRLNALSQTLLKLTSPGVPDIYQGTELWDLSLVDPDNRRPVDYAARRAELASLEPAFEGDAETLAELLASLTSDLARPGAKLFLIARVLNYRRRHPDLFTRGGYTPCDGRGPAGRHVVAFMREWVGEHVIVIAPRLTVGLVSDIGRLPLGETVWKETAVEVPTRSADRYRNWLTGEVLDVKPRGRTRELAMSEILKQFPVALLEPVTV